MAASTVAAALDAPARRGAEPTRSPRLAAVPTPVLGADPRSLGVLLRAYRGEHGLSRRAASQRLGQSESAWAGWEAGRVPSPASLLRVAALLGLSPDEARASAGPDRIRRAYPVVPDLETLPGLRSAAGLTASEVARRMHVSLSLVSRWESGERTPCTEYWPALAATLGVEVAVVERLYGGRPAARDRVDMPSLRRVRTRAGLTQPTVAGALGVDVSTFQRWERSGRVPAPRVPELTRLLRTDPAELARPVVELARPARVESALRRLRRRRYLAARCVAARVGCSQAALWSWERGATRPSWAQARGLAAALGVPLAEVFAALALDPPTHLDRAAWTEGDLPLVLRDVRRWSGLTQRELGALVGVTSLTVSAWEQGRRRPRGRSLRRLDGLLDGAVRRSL